jgi:fucose 4-O-acetylase-like acetyltransferase
MTATLTSLASTLVDAPAQVDGPALADAPAPTRKERNLAIDALRVGSMGMVVIGHWLASHIGLDEDNRITGGNGLDKMSALHWMTWIFQVMPLFFCVGGFANATSLASAERNGVSTPEWIGLRLRRLLAPVAVFAGAWLILVLAATAIGQGEIARQASRVSVIPLWFMAVYVLDIGLGPVLRTLWHRYRFGAIAGVAALVCTLDIASQLTGSLGLLKLPNALIGWSVFQLLGIAWHDRALSTGTFDESARSRRSPRSGWWLLALGR